MIMSPRARKLALAVHLTCSGGWIGAVVVYLTLSVTAATSTDTQTIRATWVVMELAGWLVIVPLALASLLTGIVMSAGTHWGLVRHWWVVISLSSTVLATGVLLLHMPTVSARSNFARTATDEELRTLGGDLAHPGIGLAILLATLLLNVYKPKGRTRPSPRDE